MSSANCKLGNLVAIVDTYKVTVPGHTHELIAIEPITDKSARYGWTVVHIDGHDVETLVDTFDNLPAADSDVPTAIICDTVAGKGVSFMEHGYEWHVANLGEDDIKRAIEEIEGGQ